MTAEPVQRATPPPDFASLNPGYGLLRMTEEMLIGRHHPLNFFASISAPRASRPVSAPTATKV
jgi:hypothetical protein